MHASYTRMFLQVVIACSSILSVTAAESSSEPDIDGIISAGKNTMSKLVTTPARWKVKFRLENGDALQTKVFRDKQDQAWTFSVAVNGLEHELARIVQTRGIWYVLDVDGSRTKWRPYEAALRMQAGYVFLSQSGIGCVVDQKPFESARFEKREGNVVRYRRSMPEQARSGLQRAVNDMVEMATKDPSNMERPSFVNTLKSGRELLEKGIPFGIDERHGIMAESEFRGGLLVSVEQFEWLDKVPSEAFGLPPNVNWNDEIKPLEVSDLVDCLMMGYDPSVSTHPSPEGFLLNLKTGHRRRLPFNGTAAVPGAFLPERKEVLISGTDASGQLGLVKLNLVTGENTLIEHVTSKGMLLATADLSPDGKKLAAIQSFGSGAEFPETQMRIIDLQSGKSELLGKRSYIGGSLSWLPDGDGLIVKRIVPAKDFRSLEPHIVCRLGLDGRLTDLRAGESPVVLRKSRRILYQDQDSRLWYTCELDGTKPVLFVGGFKDYRTPAVSPDEKRIVFVHYEKGKPPQLVVFEMGKAEGKLPVQAGSFIGMPVWR